LLLLLSPLWCRQVAIYLDSKDNDVGGRNACLELCFALYLSLGSELPKLTKLLGELSERSTAMVRKFKYLRLLSDFSFIVLSLPVPLYVHVTIVTPDRGSHQTEDQGWRRRDARFLGASVGSHLYRC
jgi:hypothetical protein